MTEKKRPVRAFFWHRMTHLVTIKKGVGGAVGGIVFFCCLEAPFSYMFLFTSKKVNPQNTETLF